MSGWNHGCGCGCGSGIPCKGFIPPIAGPYGARGYFPGPYSSNYQSPGHYGYRPNIPPSSFGPPQRPKFDSSYGWIPPSHCLGTFRWQSCFGGSVPSDAVHAGMDLNGGPIYVGRSFHSGDLLPAKVTPAHGCAYVSWGGTEFSKQEYEVLCSNHVAWKYCEGGAVPPEAIRIGNTSDGEHLFMGRTMVDGTLTPGKVHPSHGCLYVPFDGREMSFPTYEVLVLS